MKRHLFSLLIAALFLADSNASELKESRYKYVKSSIGKGKPYFLEVGAKSCASCREMSQKLQAILEKNPQYNIHFINVQKERDAAMALEVRMIPTQIIYDESGKEIYRNVGILTQTQLDELFDKYKF